MKGKLIILIIFLSFPLIAFSFDANSTHPALTEEIVKYYNSYAKRKISKEELELLKEGSKKEDKSPRWVNHFYDFLNNSGLNLATARGVPDFKIKLFLFSLPNPPLKTIDWYKNELAQIKYLDNRVYQRAKRLYFENKEEAFLTLGYILHLLEDLGVPEHARGDSHSNFSGDPPSYYEIYAKEITDKYNLKFADNLIKNKIQPYYFSEIESIFKSLAKYTSENWFSEDTINWTRPEIKYLKHEEKPGEDSLNILYFSKNDLPILKEVRSRKDSTRISKTTNYVLIQQAWFEAVTPEIIKHGAALLDLYFREIEEMEKEESLKLYESYKGLFSNLISTYVSPFYLKDYSFALLWRAGEGIYTLISNIPQSIVGLFTNNEIQEKNDYPYIRNAEKEELKEITLYQENKPSYKENPTSYKEEYTPKIIETTNKPLNKANENISLNNADIKTNELNTSTSSNTTSTNNNLENEEEANEEDEEIPKIIGGGGSINQQKKDPCDDYKNKSYPNILISEIQFETKEDTKDEFIELYNPNNEEVDLTCWKLEKYASKNIDSNSTPTLTILIPQSKFQGKIKPFSFFLITSSSTKDKYKGDLSYAESYSITKNNVIILKKPNDEISDLVGYGDDEMKIFAYEEKPFVAANFENKSIQRKNLQDTNNNLKDFWLRKPNPENSSSNPRHPREDFIDLSEVEIEDFKVFVTSTEEAYYLNISFKEPSISVTSTNYSYEVSIFSLPEIKEFKLLDFEITSTLPQPKFDGSLVDLNFEMKKCPATSTSYNFYLYVKDSLDEENISKIASSSINFPNNLCSNEGENIVLENYPKILISEIRILEGTSTNEYIELYNPNDFEVDLKGWNLIKINREGNEEYIFSTTSKAKYKLIGTIKPFGYFLIANSSNNLKETFNIEPDAVYSKDKDFAKNNKLKLINPKGEVVSFVEWGSFDGELILLRKAGVSSTVESMKNEEKDFGNSYYSESYKDEFLIFDTPEPQNSKSNPEIPPDNLSKFEYSLNDNILKIKFISPYRILTDAKYLIKDNSKNEVINLNLPEVKPFGEYTEINLNACDLPQNISFVLKIKDEEKYSYPIEINNVECPIYKSEGYKKFSWGRNSPTTVRSIAQQINIEEPVNIRKVKLKISKIEENPGDKVFAELWSCGQGKPETGELISKSKEIDESLIPKTFDDLIWIDFEFESAINLLPGCYFVVFKRNNFDETKFYISLYASDIQDKGNRFWYYVGSEGGWEYRYRKIDSRTLVESLAIIVLK